MDFVKFTSVDINCIEFICLLAVVCELLKGHGQMMSCVIFFRNIWRSVPRSESQAGLADMLLCLLGWVNVVTLG